jgi:hypothetical protein
MPVTPNQMTAIMRAIGITDAHLHPGDQPDEHPGGTLPDGSTVIVFQDYRPCTDGGPDIAMAEPLAVAIYAPRPDGPAHDDPRDCSGPLTPGQAIDVLLRSIQSAGPPTGPAARQDHGDTGTFTFTAQGRNRTLTMIRALNRNGHAWAVIRHDAAGLPPVWATWTRTGPASWISTVHGDRIEDDAAARRWRPPARPDGRYLTAIMPGTGRWADTQHARLASRHGRRTATAEPRDA